VRFSLFFRGERRLTRAREVVILVFQIQTTKKVLLGLLGGQWAVLALMTFLGPVALEREGMPFCAFLSPLFVTGAEIDQSECGRCLNGSLVLDWLDIPD
jgi:hypothetical protein